MKRSTFIFIIACIATLSIVGCKNTNKKTQQENTSEISLASKALDVNGLLNVAEEQLNERSRETHLLSLRTSLFHRRLHG